MALLQTWRGRLRAILVLAGLQAAAAVPPAWAQAPEATSAWAERARACSACHAGSDRRSAEGYIPRIAGKPAAYLGEQLRQFRDGRRHQDSMARQLAHLNDAYLDGLAAHFASLKPAAYTPGPAPAVAAATRARAWVRQGDAGRGVPACSACHGESLAGDGDRVPGLLGLPADYLVAQLGAWRSGARQARAPDCMAEIVHRLPTEAIGDIARWLAAQPVTAAPAAAPAPAAAASSPLTQPLACGSASPRPAPAPMLPAAPAPSAAAQRGAYLALLGNCAGCHSTPGGPAYAGGRALATPFGTVYAGNLTPDAETGLGRWRAEDFWQALHHGRGKDGRRLLPAFPYTAYTHVRRADADDLFAFLQSLPPVRRPNTPHALRFPYNTPLAMLAWQALYFRPATPAPQEADPLARGAYLVQGLGHCGACHAPRNALGAPAAEARGGEMPAQRWYAPSLHPSPLAPRSADELVRLLREGQTARDVAAGPMAEVVLASTQHWTEADLRAVAAYLGRLAPQAVESPPAPALPALYEAGRRLYARHCADCHGEQGQGRPGVYPALAGNATVLQPSARNLVQLMRHGGFAPSTRSHPWPHGMPHQGLSAAEMAAVASFVRQSWGNRASALDEVGAMRLQ